MARRALAPVLSAFIDGGDDVNRSALKVQAAAELRALLAVAQAACALTRPPAQCPPITPEITRLFRALSRLARAKGKP